MKYISQYFCLVAKEQQQNKSNFIQTSQRLKFLSDPTQSVFITDQWLLSSRELLIERLSFQNCSSEFGKWLTKWRFKMNAQMSKNIDTLPFRPRTVESHQTSVGVILCTGRNCLGCNKMLNVDNEDLEVLKIDEINMEKSFHEQLELDPSKTWLRNTSIGILRLGDCYNEAEIAGRISTRSVQMLESEMYEEFVEGVDQKWKWIDNQEPRDIGLRVKQLQSPTCLKRYCLKFRRNFTADNVDIVDIGSAIEDQFGTIKNVLDIERRQGMWKIWLQGEHIKNELIKNGLLIGNRLYHLEEMESDTKIRPFELTERSYDVNMLLDIRD
eukprot:gene10430-19132_t